MARKEPIFYQLFEQESSTYTYIIADPATREAAIIDPVLETIERDLQLLSELGVELKYILDTHIHADHITAAGELRKRTHGKSAVSSQAKVDCVDIPLEDGQELFLGEHKITALATPGHTNSCMSFVFNGRVFTGDALLIRGTGRTDFQQGSSERLFESITQKLFELPGDTKVYPAHDYRGQTSSTVALEKKFNPRVAEGTSREAFVQTMAELKLANPKKIHEAVPANMACGVLKEAREISPTLNDGIPEVSVQGVREALGRVRLIDVREPQELTQDGFIEGAERVTLGPELDRFLQEGNRAQEIVFICRSGGRSGEATAQSLKLGYKFTANMVGGMLQWRELGYPAVKEA